MLRRLAGQTAIYGISSVAARLLNYMLTPIFTRIMPTPDYGVVTDMYALIPFALVVLTMGMETGYFRFAGKAEGVNQKRDVFATCWGATSALALLFFVLAAIFINPLADVMEYADHHSYVMIVAAIIALDVITAIPFARLREQKRPFAFVGIRVLSIVINVGLCLFFFGALPHLPALWGIMPPDFGVGYVFVANLIASMITFVVILSTTNRIIPKIDPKLFRTIFLYSLPLLISGIAGTANEYIDRQMIKYLLPSDVAFASLGIYGAVVKIAVIMTLFTQMYRLAAEPFFLENFKKEDFKIVNAVALKYYTIVSIAIFLMISLFSDIFALIVGASFREGIFILPVILLTNLFTGLTFNLSFWYKQSGETKYAIMITGAGFVVTFGLTYILIPVMGYAGAAWASLACSVTTTLISYLLNQKHFPIPYDVGRIAIYFLLAGAIYAISVLMGHYSAPMAIKYTVNILMLIGFATFALRMENINILQLLKRE